MLVQGPIFQGEGSTVLVESHHTPIVAPSTSPPHISSTLRSPIRQETEVPQLSSPPHTNVADEAASTGVDVRHGGAATTVTSLDVGQGSDKCEALETDLRQTKKVYSDAFTRLIKKVTPTKVSAQQDQPEDHLRVFSAAKVLADATINVHTYTRRRRTVSTSSGEISTAKESVSTVGASMPVNTADETERADSNSRDEEVALKLQEEIQAEERETYSEAEKARLLAELINQRKKYFTQQRDEERRNKPLTQVQQRTYMCNYIKHMGSHTLHQLKRLSFDELKALFETTMRRVLIFHPIESEGDKIVPELTTGSSKRVAEVELDHKGSKKQKTNEASGSIQEQPEEEETELLQEDLQQMMMVVPVEEVYVEALQVKYPIIDWEVYSEDTRRYWKIIRVGNHTEAYQTFDDMLKKFDRDDLDKLWSLVKERFSSTDPTDDKKEHYGLN
ncbi:hypothetical protein Tco_0661330 [Tanacetum coccineum]